MEDKNYIKIMEDKGPWKFSNETITKLKQWNPKAMQEFYYDNLEIITKMAYKFVRNRVDLFRDYSYDVQDLIQQVYIDLPYYDFRSRINLWYCIVKGSFLRVNEGGITTSNNRIVRNSLIFSYDAPVKGKSESSSYLLDKCSYTCNPIDILIEKEERENKDNEICSFLERTVKDSEDLNIMFCTLFTNLKLDEIEGDEYEYYKQCKQRP